jgi:hypothetical protein
MRQVALKKLDPPISVSTTIEGVDLFITHVGRGRAGLPRVRAQVWNGKLLAADILEPDELSQRRRLARAASAADPGLIPDPDPIAMALLDASDTLHSVVAQQEAEGDGAPFEAAEPERILSANFPGLVDVVAGDDGVPAYLVVDPDGEHGLAVVEEHLESTGDGENESRLLTPPPLQAIPWRLPRAAEVQRWAAPGADDPRVLYEDVAACLKRHVHLPELPGSDEYPDAYVDLFTAWQMHCHILEMAAYSPILALIGPPERGKSRLGRTQIYLSRRGIHTETLREANLFRDSQDRRATLFIDCTGLWKKAEKLGCEDILLNRFERGPRVSRVLYPDKGPFADTVYYDIFGATILASNEPLGRILDTRCIPISMPLAPVGVEYPVPTEDELLPLRERLTAWRARQMVTGWKPDPMEKPAGSRLGDVLLPLAQIIAAVAPDRLPALRALAKHLEGARQQERAMSWEAAIIGAVAELADSAHNGLLLIDVIAERVNLGRPDEERLTNRRISGILTLLGLKTRKAHGNKAALVVDKPEITRIASHYTDAENTPEKAAGTPPDNANHATHANQNGSETGPDERKEAPAYSVDSMVSVSTGDTQDYSDALFPEANPDANHGRCARCRAVLRPDDADLCTRCEAEASA